MWQHWLANLIATVGVSIVAAVAVCKWLVQKWIEQRFNVRLERLKADQQRELERLKQFWSGRISKIHEKEFEVLPKAWLMLHDAYGSAAHALAALKEYPDFGRLPEAQFEEFLTTMPASRLSNYQKDALRQASDRQKYFADAMEGCDVDDAENKVRVFNNYLIENRIFMTDDLREKFAAVFHCLSTALTSYSVGKRAKDWDMQRAGIEKVTGLKDKIDDVERAVQRRLHYEEA